MTRFGRLLIITTALSLMLSGLIYLLMLATIPHASPLAKISAGYYNNWALSMGGGYALCPEGDWTLKIGRACCGIQKYPFATRFVCGRFSALTRLPFTWVIAIGSAFVTAL